MKEGRRENGSVSLEELRERIRSGEIGEVVARSLNTARVEQATYDAAVTCWERVRYLERG